MRCIMASLQHEVNTGHLQGLQNEGPAPLPVLVHHCPGAAGALSKGAAHQTVLGEAPAQLSPATAASLHYCIHHYEVICCIGDSASGMCPYLQDAPVISGKNTVA